jgi:hypothetical protein
VHRPGLGRPARVVGAGVPAVIRPRPDTDAWKLLTLVVDHPGEVSPAEAAGKTLVRGGL